MLDRTQDLVSLFLAQAQATPAAVALEDERRTLTYAELEQTTRALAHHLTTQFHVGRDVLVGILMPRCAEYVVAALAILRAGGAFLVLELAYPDKLIREVIADARPSLVLMTQAVAHRAPDGVPTLQLDQWAPPRPSGTIVSPPLPRAALDPDQLAFVSYSSGTTGKPKGIANPHRAAVGSYALRFNLSDLAPGDRVACNVFFIWEMLRPLLRGATTVAVPDTRSYDPDGLLEFLQQHQITETLMTPTLLATILAARHDHHHPLPLPHLRSLWLNGEVVTADLCMRAAQALPNVRILNVYSISETHEVGAGDVTAMMQDPQVQGSTVCPVGQLLDPDHAYILAEDTLERVPVGTSGELCVGGPLLARGYLNLPEQTAKAFIPDPFHPGKRMYRTGDQARLLPTGLLEITGRIGGMIKARGYTVHPAAVEAAIVKYLGVQACAVVGQGEGVDKRLVAYIVPDPQTPSPVAIESSGHSPEARKILTQHLAHYMIPSIWMLVNELPTHSVSGKIDVSALPAPPPLSRPSTRPGFPGSSNPSLGACQVREDLLIENWSLVLCVPEATIKTKEHSFFDLGGHSLLLADLAGRLSKAFGFTVPLGALAADPSLQGHMAAITAARDGHLAELQCDLPNIMSIDATLPDYVQVQFGTPKGRDILLTGATGYLGAFLLRSLVARTPPEKKIVCLIRFPYPTDNCSPAGLARIRNNLNDLGLWHDDLLDRIEVVPGNLPQARLGLEAEAFEQLAHRVGTVVHAAAAVNLVYPYAALRAANVGGTREILRLCALGGASLHHISTNGVLPCSATQAWSEDTHITVEQASKLIPDGYGQSKWAAEQLVLQAQNRGMDAHIYRPGTLSGCDETGSSNPYDMLDAVLIESLRMGSAPVLEGWRCEMTPVNYVADAVAALAATPPAKEDQKAVYHLGDRDPPLASEVFDVLASLGYPTKRIPFDEWASRWRALQVDPASIDPNQKTPFTTDILKGGFPTVEALREVPILDDRATQKVLTAMLGYERPQVDQRLWRTYTRHFFARGWLPYGPQGSNSHPALPNGKPRLSDHLAPKPRMNGTASLKPTRPPGRLQGKVAVVTGASSGIGAAVAEALAREGAHVAIAARRVEALQGLKKRILASSPPGVQVLVGKTDVTQRAQVESLVQAAELNLGPVDIFVSCAGVMYFTMMANALTEQWEQTVDVNCKGLLHCLSSSVPAMLQRGRGHIVAISSDAGRKTFAGLGVYSASKFFVEATLQALRLETAGQGLRVTSIQPGNVATDLLGMSTDQEALKKFGEPSGAKVLDPQDVAQAIVYALVQPEHVAVNEVLVEPRDEPI